jgi:hypothetical protein
MDRNFVLILTKYFIEMHLCLQQNGVSGKIDFAVDFYNTDIFSRTHSFCNTGASFFIGMITSRRMKWEDNIKMDHTKKGVYGLESSCLGYGPVVGYWENCNESLDSIKKG